MIIRALTLALCLTAPAIGGMAHTASLIAKVQTNQARYAPGTPVVVSVTLTNPAGQAPITDSVSLACLHLDAPVPGPSPQTIRLAGGKSGTLRFLWHPPQTDYQGYLVAARVRDAAGRVLDARTTAVDVSSNWTKFPRYGFLSGYPAQSSAVSRAQIQEMNDFHLNAVQFYDWQWRHEKPLAGTAAHPAAFWKDLANRSTSRQTILDFIQIAHEHGMAAMNYNLLYGAWSGYSHNGVEYYWGLWNQPNGTNQYSASLPAGWATPQIYLFNPASPDWQKYLIKEEANVFAAYPFDGWQVDQIGAPPGKVYDYSGNVVDVWKTFKPFLNAAKPALNKTIIFNNVGGYGLYDTAANTREDAAYIECWPFAGQTTYSDLKTTIDQARQWSGGKAVILAAYMDYEHGKTFSGRAPGAFNMPGALLTDAAIFAAGGAHIELGDGAQMLDNEYFPNHNLIPSPELRETVRRYYDFLVAYENPLRDGVRKGDSPVTLSVPSSMDAAPNKVWSFTQSGGGGQTLHLINLIGEKNNAWRDDQADYPAPTPQTNVVVTYYASDYASGTVQKVAWASPDTPDIALRPLPFTTGRDAGGAYVRFTVPRLAYWDMILLTISPPASKKG